MLQTYHTHQGKIILLVVIAAFIGGVLVPHIFAPLEFISNTFISLLKLCALPIILTSLIVTIGTLDKLHELKIVARNSIAYILITEVAAVSIGLLVFNSIDISGNINASSLLSGAKYSGSTSTAINPAHVFNYIFPANIFESLVKFDVLPVVVFSILFGITCALNQEKAKPVLDLMQSIREMFLILLNGVMYLAPLAIFVLIGTSVAESYLSGSLAVNLLGLVKFVGLFFLALFLHFLWQLLLVVALYRELGVRQILKEALPIFTTAFVSSSSLVTLPLALNKAIKLGGKNKVVILVAHL